MLLLFFSCHVCILHSLHVVPFNFFDCDTFKLFILCLVGFKYDSFFGLLLSFFS